MIRYCFKRESNDFDDIIKDKRFKKHYLTMLRWSNHLLLSLPDDISDETQSFFVLLYGDDLCNPFEKDFSPVVGIDYVKEKKN